MIFIETISIFYLKFKENNENDMLHMEFVLIFITGPSQGKLGKMTRQQLLTLVSLGYGDLERNLIKVRYIFFH